VQKNSGKAFSIPLPLLPSKIHRRRREKMKGGKRGKEEEEVNSSIRQQTTPRPHSL
jgi:hypothetical protein